MTATRLTANAEQSIALARRQLAERAAIVRGRVEAMRGCGLVPKMNAVENRLRLLQFSIAKEMLDEIDDALEDYRRRQAEAEMAEAAAKQDALRSQGGDDTARTASGVGSRHGLLWLIAKGRLAPHRKTAGMRWSDDYSLTRTDGLRSCLNDNGAPGTGTDVDRPEDRRLWAEDRLRCARQQIGSATGCYRLADLLDAVCGRGDSLRAMAKGDDRRALALEVELCIALDMAAVSYGVIRPPV